MSLILSPGPPQAGPLFEAGDWPPVPVLLGAVTCRGQQAAQSQPPPAIDSDFYAGFSLSCV